MTFNELLTQFQQKYDAKHDVVFFELVFCLSDLVTTKEKFVQMRSEQIDFKERKFWKMCHQYFKLEKPLAHITGTTTFCGLTFQVHKKVLAPRENTEQMTKDFISAHTGKISAGTVLLDLCCGCGCIGIAIKQYVPQFSVICVDKYYAPFLNSHQNARLLETDLTLDCKDAVKYLNKKTSVDYIISNPPYVNKLNFPDAKKIMKWERKRSLIAHDGGMYFYNQFLKWLNDHDFKEAWFEIGFDLTETLRVEMANYPNLQAQFPAGKHYMIVTKKIVNK